MQCSSVACVSRWLLVAFWLLLAPTARPASVDLDWDLSSSNLVAGVRVYWGYAINPALSNAVARATNASTATTSITVSNVGAAVIHFQATAYTIDGIESLPSNDLPFTNYNFGPINLQIIRATNDTAAIWVQNQPTNMMVQWSADLSTWHDYCSIKGSDPTAPPIRSVFVAGVKPDAAAYFRVISLEASMLPVGMALKLNSAPVSIPHPRRPSSPRASSSSHGVTLPTWLAAPAPRTSAVSQTVVKPDNSFPRTKISP